MSCTAHEELVKKWLELVEWTPNRESAVSAYLQVEEHRNTCKVCRDERFEQLADQESFEHRVKITLVIKLPIAK